MRTHLTSRLFLTVLAIVLGVGWASREVAHAQQAAKVVESSTVNLGQVEMKPYEYEGEKVGQAGAYLNGDTAGTKNFVTGRFVLDAGKTPHAPHVHPEEEVMIVETGTGDIVVDGKVTRVGPGSVMYTGPNVSHGIVNTGEEPLTFYFIKYDARGRD